jgi:cytochrome b
MENTQFIKVWNIAIRAFHWTLVGCFILAFISSENLPKLHVIFGYSVLTHFLWLCGHPIRPVFELFISPV